MAVDLIYCATPSRMGHKTNQIVDFVNFQTPYAPFHPFVAFPWNKFEGNSKIGRENTMNYCINSIGICNRFGLFGISEGTTVIELPIAIKLDKPINIYLEKFDEDWKTYVSVLARKYPETLNNLKKIGVIYD